LKKIKEMAFAAASSGKDPTEKEGEKPGSVPVQAEEVMSKAQIKKRNEIADAIKRENPEYSDKKKFSIATAQAMKEKQIEENVDKAKMKCNAPRADSHNGKSHVVKACFDGKEKVIRFGQAGVQGSPDGTDRNKRFKTRHAKNIAKGPKSAAYWANKVKW